ncbi:MAG: hypothetical protein IT204_02050 [Fimbriimonadaceae bacterium]|nr:hypothetical protein [Fimbriimonadaceae bacterium]
MRRFLLCLTALVLLGGLTPALTACGPKAKPGDTKMPAPPPDPDQKDGEK